jgi:hypothetical protein
MIEKLLFQIGIQRVQIIKIKLFSSKSETKSLKLSFSVIYGHTKILNFAKLIHNNLQFSLTLEIDTVIRFLDLLNNRSVQ